MSEIFRTEATHTFKIETDLQGGRLQTVSVSKDRILPLEKHKGRSKKRPPAQYLLIGFDTEYQSIDPIDVSEVRREDGIAVRNTVLSYQFFVRLVSLDADVTGLETSGIIIPEDGERLQLQDFIAFAIGDWLEAHPTAHAPSNIYLIGHFTRADLPAFQDFRDLSQKHLTAIRNTIVTMGSKLKIIVGDDIEFHVEVRDTILLAPANAKSLSALGTIIGFSKISLHSDIDEEIRLKGNMTLVRNADWELFRRYAIRDAEICVHYAERIMRQHFELFGLFEIPVTLTSFGTGLVLQGWNDAGLGLNDILGREEVEETIYSKKRKRYQSKTSTPHIDLVHSALPFVTEAYHGGRNEQFIFGPAPEGDWSDVDLSSAYTTAMSLICLPKWSDLRWVYELDEIGDTDLAFALIDFEFPPGVRFPTLPVRTPNGIIFPRTGTTHCGAPEIKLAERLGAKLTVKQALRVPTDASTPVFREFIKDCISRRKDAKTLFDNMFWKEVGNSTYGKTAQGLRKKRVYDLREDDVVELSESRITQPFFAAFITSYTRAVLGEILNSFSSDVQVFSVTTDGFLSTAGEAEIAKALSLPLVRSFRNARFELIGDSGATEVKHKVRQPIGWRTRGSATLIPADWGEKGIVLQKGGIKTNELLDGERENDHIVDLFLTRTPQTRIQYTNGIGIKDMIHSDTDFVMRENDRRLRMEFDWKRKPSAPHDATFSFAGAIRSHLSFGSDPCESVGEFMAIRKAWEKYNKSRAICLKSMADFEQFERYLRTSELPAAITKYASKTDGDIKRLRRDLCRAFTSKVAGFTSAERISYKEFCHALESCGIPCKVSDIDNGKKSAFEPRTCIDSVRVREALRTLKANHFHPLDISAFLELDAATSPPENDNALMAEAA